MFKRTFQGGVFLADRKEATVDRRARPIPAPRELILPLCQHTGAPNEPVVTVGDRVRRGQLLGEAKAFVSAPIHSPVSGSVKAIRDFPNPLYGKGPAIFIENDKKNESVPFAKRENPEELPPGELINIVKDKGIVGLGGAAFPAHAKLKVPDGKNVDTLIINGAECEPYLTCDHRLMVERPNEILKGAYLIAGILGVKNIFLAIEENKLSAIFTMEKVALRMKKHFPHISLQIVSLRTKYPQGGENQLIKAILGKEVPPGRFPPDVGAMVHNVGTCFAIYEAAYEGKPLIERCVTFTGDCLKEPGNFIVPLGTPIKFVVNYCGGFQRTPSKIIVGGPMMGITQFSLETPVTKGVTGIVFLSKQEAEIHEDLPCIRCAKCVDVCPVNLLPTEIMRMVKYSKWRNMEKLRASDCMECGACAWACSSKVPLVQYIKLAKAREAEKK